MKKNILIDTDKKEYPVHLLQGFPVGIMENKFSSITYNSIDWHWHDEFQFTIISKGKFLFYIGKEKIILEEGEGLFINSQKIHTSQALSSDASYLFIYFHPNLIPHDKDSYIYKKYIKPILKDENLGAIKFSKNTKEILNIIHKIKEISDKKQFGYELEILTNLIDIWRYTVIFVEENSEEKKLIFSENGILINERLKKIIGYIDENYDNKFSLKNISDLVNLSQSECCRFFKKATNKTLSEFLLNFRINRALNELINTEKSISEIAYDNGFSSQSYFSKKFLEIKKISPKQVRREYKKILNKQELE